MRKIESKALFTLSKSLAGLILAGVCAVASASGEPKPFDAASVLEQQKQIRGDVEAKRGVYGQMNGDTRKELLLRQERLTKLLEGQRYEELSPANREQAHADLAWIELAASGQEEEKVVCERVRTTGSNRVERVCRTVGQRREDQRVNREGFESMRQRTPGPPCASTGC
ncbi:hypothetical protein ACI2IY_02245 [Lysobacter enzymogenes]|uniref:hypothetical protein n=1 Tax=Lysobacter enzymogenes TaxID=69 RepID=UPI003850FE0D